DDDHIRRRASAVHSKKLLGIKPGDRGEDRQRQADGLDKTEKPPKHGKGLNESAAGFNSQTIPSFPQMPFKWLMPCLTASTGRRGLSSNTLMCSGLIYGLSAAKLIIPSPGAWWSRAGNLTSCRW